MADAFSYAKSGIDINETDQAKRDMAKSLESSDPRVLNRIGAFASIYDASFPELEHPVLMLKTEEPGSKQLLAFQYNRIEGICFDMINHLVNDIIVMGAKPHAVQDAIICGKMVSEDVKALVGGIAKACRENDCSLTGGETSVQPGVLEAGRYVLTASIVGVADRDKIIDGSRIAEGDVVIALASNGLHTNGYTLVRSLMASHPEILERQVDGRSFIDAIMEPHRPYYKSLRGIFGEPGLKGMAHITGGGIQDNLNRILPKNLDALVDLSKIKTLPIFKLLREFGSIEDAEMLRIFNCGVGLCAVVSQGFAARAIKHIEGSGYRAYPIGSIVSGEAKVRFEGSLGW